MQIRRALISVSDKEEIVDFARELNSLGIEIISTGGTAKLLREKGIDVIPISDVTNFPEVMDGRVKTLHPKIHGGILAIRSNKEHVEAMDRLGIKPIDMVVVNLYPFKKTIAKPDVALEDAIENIDIGGPTMIRAAAKNYQDVVIVTKPSQYNQVLEELKKGDISLETRKKLALEVFEMTADYENAITDYLGKEFGEEKTFPEILNLRFEKVQETRYGENPYQKAAFYKDFGVKLGVASAEQLHGKELSFNNIADADAALRMIKEFGLERPTVVIMKHMSPCGVASADTLVEAYRKAFATDEVSPFGGIISVNRKLDLETAKEINKIFVEVVIAPDFEEDALTELRTKKNLRILKADLGRVTPNTLDFRGVYGGLLVQDYDAKEITEKDLKVVTERKPTSEEVKELLFAWKVCRGTKSNAIILCRGEETLGIGGGQPSRVESVQLAVKRARDFKGTENAVLASDSFFPFKDGVDEAAKAGVKAIIQNGGSARDDEVIKAANEHGMVMVFTGTRCFRH